MADRFASRWKERRNKRRTLIFSTPFRTYFPAELGSGPAEIMRPQTLPTQSPRRRPDHVPHRPVAPTLAHFPPVRMIRRSRPSPIPAAACQALMARLTQTGTATVRTRLPLPRRSAVTQRFSRIWISPTSSAASSLLRSAHPTRRHKMQASRLSLRVSDRGPRGVHEPAPGPASCPAGFPAGGGWGCR